jgi:hypothetical protein
MTATLLGRCFVLLSRECRLINERSECIETQSMGGRGRASGFLAFERNILPPWIDPHNTLEISLDCFRPHGSTLLSVTTNCPGPLPQGEGESVLDVMEKVKSLLLILIRPQ